MNKEKKPNFLIAGAGRSGTTSLAEYLNQHPDIFMYCNPSMMYQKEPRFFVKELIESISDLDPMKKGILKYSVLDEKKYFELFKTEKKFKVYGEASIHYFNHPEISIKNILKFLGDIPIIIILRNPVEKLISNWKFIGADIYPLDTSLEMEILRKEIGYNSFWFYKDQSFYFERVKKFINSFTKVKVIILEEFTKNPKQLLNDCTDFLDIKKNDFNIDITHNESKENFYLKKKYINKYLKKPIIFKYFSILFEKFKLNKLNFFFVEKKSDYKVNKKEIYNYFSNDIQKLEKLINKDLSLWKY